MTASANAKTPSGTPSKSTYIPSIPPADLAVTTLHKSEQKRSLSGWSRINLNKKTIAVAAFGLALAGCQGGTNYKANVYTAAELNQKVDTLLVNILAITPAQIEVDNSQNKKVATVFGAVLGAVIGAQNSGRHQGQSTVVGAVAGGAMGSLVSSTQLVDGVQLSYQDKGQLVTSVQVGSLCEFKLGQAVSMVIKQNETRIQPNATCNKGDK
ncbi:MAG: glycine zipper 2TM domain-containing protein [Pseudomonadales bacterium]|nr:glycine zipper 2TM domain-containing protein [Pseudomonadales bacterium]